MSRAKDLPCWEIMNCRDDSDCPAKHSKNKSCWELARDFKHLQNIYDACRDCIVYLIKGDNNKFTDEELNAILLNRKLSLANHPKCISLKADFSEPDDERRRVKRFKISESSPTISHSPSSANSSGKTKIAFSDDSDCATLQIIDISRGGIAFLAPDECLEKRDLRLDIQVNGYHLKELSGTVIPHPPHQLGDENLRRCGFRFTELSGSQLSILDNMLMECG